MFCAKINDINSYLYIGSQNGILGDEEERGPEISSIINGRFCVHVVFCLILGKEIISHKIMYLSHSSIDLWGFCFQNTNH